MPGRLTAAARHLVDPTNKIYFADMEGMLYEADVHSLEVTKLFSRMAPGAHCKGAYSSQGRLVVSNNGNIVVNNAKLALTDPQYAADPESAGVLAEWDGKDWDIVQRRQFTDITGPGGISGAPSANSPLWAIGWDKRSIILELLEDRAWHSYRMPIADYSYVAAHGWYTEWPRIREVGDGKFLMNMHGGWFDFPKAFSAANTAGVRPIGSYLKITGDFAPWKGGIVFGCDDGSILENPLLGQSQSNLWFTDWNALHQCGRPGGSGGPWVNDDVTEDTPSTPYLFAGYSQRVVHLWHQSNKTIGFTLEIDRDGKGDWKPYRSIMIKPHTYQWLVIPANVRGEWVRVRACRDCRGATAFFTYGPGGGAVEDPSLFTALAPLGSSDALSASVLRPIGNDRGTLVFIPAHANGGNPSAKPLELAPNLKWDDYRGPAIREPEDLGAAKDYHVQMDEASLVVTDATGRYRLPVGMGEDAASHSGAPIYS